MGATAKIWRYSMNLKPLFDKVVLKDVELTATTASGLLLTGAAKEKEQIAEVVAVGPGGLIDGKETKMVVAIGDTVLYGKYAGAEVKLDNQKYIIVRQSDILAIIEK